MPFPLLSWAIGYASTKGLDQLLAHKSLAVNLQKAFKQWAKKLPSDAFIDPDSNFAQIDPELNPEKQPSLCALRQTLLDNHIPAESQWLDALLEQWRLVPANVEETQKFFKLPKETAQKHLTCLAKALTDECAKHDPLFKTGAIDLLRKTNGKLDTIDGKIDVLLEQVKLKPALHGQIHNLPYRSIGDLFKGRDDILAELKKQLGKTKPTAITQNIQGLGGIGKTRLAVEFGWWGLNHKKYQAVFFVSSETPEILKSSLASLTKKGLLGLAGEKEDEQIESVLRWLGENTGWLMILDNADTKDAADSVEDLLPRLSAGRVIITSRYTRWSAAVSPNTLGLLDKDKAEEFLLQRTAGRRSETKQDTSNAEKLAKELGYLPLALEQAAAYIAHEQTTLGDYLVQWQSDKKDVLGWCNEREMNYPVSVAVTWQRTFEKLSLEGQAVLRLAAFLAPEPLPVVMFEEGKEIVAEAADVIAKESGKGAKSKYNTNKTIGELAAYSMIAKEAKTFTIHRIVQEVIRSRIAEDNRRLWIGKALRIVNNYAPTEAFDVRTWPIWDVLRPHAEYIAETADKENITDPTSRLMSVLGTYLHYKGLYSEAEKWKCRALEIDEKSFGKDHPKVATDLNNLAQLYKATNRLSEAEPMYKRALAIDEASFGKDHPDVARDLNNLAQLYQDTNRLSEAEPLMKRALAIDEAGFGKDHPKVAIRLNNLAQLYQATNRLSEAEPMMKRVVEILENPGGEPLPNYAGALNNLAMLYKATNRLSEAEPLMKRALEIDEAGFGKDHPNVAMGLNNLAQLYQDTNRLSEAEPLMKRALAIDEASFGKDHPNVAIRLNNLAMLYQATNRLSEAEPLMKRALEIFEQTYGPDHPDTQTVRQNLEALLRSQKQ